MKWIHLTIVGFALSNVGALGFVIYAHLSPPPQPQLRYVEVQTWSDLNAKSHDNVEILDTDDAECLAQAEAWHQSFPGLTLRQRWILFTGTLCEISLRPADFYVTLVHKDGHREKVEVWVNLGGAGKVFYRHKPFNFSSREQPFRRFVNSLRDVPR